MDSDSEERNSHGLDHPVSWHKPLDKGSFGTTTKQVRYLFVEIDLKSKSLKHDHFNCTFTFQSKSDSNEEFYKKRYPVQR